MRASGLVLIFVLGLELGLGFKCCSNVGHARARSLSPFHRRPLPPLITPHLNPNPKHIALALAATTTETSREPTRGDTGGAALLLEGVCISIGDADLMAEIDWKVMKGERWGLVGKNGAGKSTLLRALLGSKSVNVREGKVVISREAKVGYLEQTAVSGSTRTVREEVASRMSRLTQATAKLERAEQRVTEGDASDEALLNLEEAAKEFEAAGGYTQEQTVANILKGLGFVESDYDRSCTEFSGGWQMRIALARLLLSEPDLLLLDEPTNHLDAAARSWLARYLSTYKGTLLVVSHDPELLRGATQSIAESRNGKLDIYRSRSYDQWQQERDERIRVLQSQYEAQQKEIERVQVFVDRFGAKATKASAAESKKKMIEKMREQQVDPDSFMVSDFRPKLTLPEPPKGAVELLELREATFGWSPDSPIVYDVNLIVERGQRLAIRGPNGAGKSTLLAALAGKIECIKGRRIGGDGLQLGVFTQDLAQDLPQDKTAVEVVLQEVRSFDASISDERARSVLGALGLTGEKALRLVGQLSGGEKARVALAMFSLTPHNVLLLDEPSNHLDVVTLGVLTEALQKFEGAIVVVSHDRQFLEALSATHVATVKDGRCVCEQRPLTPQDWEEGDMTHNAATGQTPTPKQEPIQQPSCAQAIESEEDRKLRHNAPRRIKNIESELKKLEAKLADLDNEMMEAGSDVGKVLELNKKRSPLSEKIDALYSEYETLLEVVQ